MRWRSRASSTSIWAKWLGPNTEYKMVREEKVSPLADLKFELLP
jgi:polar amino acid transport system substrate-binding protein